MPLDVFLLVMAFLTSATSLAAALVQYQTAKIAAQGTRNARNAVSAAEGTRNARNAVSAAEGARAHNCPSRRQKNAYRRSRGEKFANFSRNEGENERPRQPPKSADFPGFRQNPR